MADETITYEDPVKVDEYTIEITRVITLPDVVVQYNYAQLVAQRAAIQADLAAYTAARQAELAEIDVLIAHCEALGTTAPTDPIIENPPPE